MVMRIDSFMTKRLIRKKGTAMKKKKYKLIVVFLFGWSMLISSILLCNDIDVNADGENEAKEEEANYEESIDDMRAEIIRAATEYLLGQMDDDGSFNEGYVYNTTAEVSFVLCEFTNEDVTKSALWLREKNYNNNVDSLSRYIIASNDSKTLDDVFIAQNKDGGFGLTDEFQSDVLDSLLVLEAANRCVDIDHTGGVKRLSQYLANKCHNNGAYSFVEDGSADSILSSQVLYALLVYKEKYADKSNTLIYTIASILKYVDDVYKADFSAEEIEQSLYAAIALKKAGLDSEYENNIKVLQRVQKDNGSFYDSIHLSALVIWYLGELDKDQPIIVDKHPSLHVEPNYTPGDGGKINHEDIIDAERSENSHTEYEIIKVKDEESEKQDRLKNTQNEVAVEEYNNLKTNTDNMTNEEIKSVSQAVDKDMYNNPRTSDSFNAVSVFFLGLSIVMVPVLIYMKKTDNK